MDESIPFGSRDYFIFFALLLFSRGMDFLSTWIATPHLVLEGNPIAKWLGWKWGAVVNVVLVVTLAMWPLSALVISTASVLVAARNFQSAWLMRTRGKMRTGCGMGSASPKRPSDFTCFALPATRCYRSAWAWRS